MRRGLLRCRRAFRPQRQAPKRRGDSSGGAQSAGPRRSESFFACAAAARSVQQCGLLPFPPEPAVPSLLPNVDPEGLLEYSVVYTDRAINHMSGAFQRVMTDIAGTLKRAYRAQTAIIVPGSGTFGMEAVARQFATDRNCLVIRKGWSGSPCCALVMLGEHARTLIDTTTGSSFACDLRKWMQIMETYEKGGHAYHATMPTDALARCRDAMRETEDYGFDRARAA